MKDLEYIKKSIGLNDTKDRANLMRYLNLKLAANGLAYYAKDEFKDLGVAENFVRSIQEKNRKSPSTAPVQKRIQSFLNDYLGNDVAELPKNHLVLDRYGLARELSLAPDKNKFETDIINSFRTAQGVLHNPKNDRRTTKGVFHIVDEGLPVPPDKKEVPKAVFKKFLQEAFYGAPNELMRLPYTSSQEDNAETFVSLQLQPLVSPEVEDISPAKKLEVFFLVPGNLVANLDFVESIFGNAGDPHLPENDISLMPENWTGHTGCVILAPHLLKFTKKELGLPNKSEATERQIKDGMCWENEDELYNDGSPFKICCRDDRGVIVTIITDNYFGYCKKEVKTQISYSANLYGLAEEEHAGGAIAYASFNLAEIVSAKELMEDDKHRFDQLTEILGDKANFHSQGYAIDSHYPNTYYLSETSIFNLQKQLITWQHQGSEQSLRLLANHIYILPNGYKVHMEKHPNTPSWRLVGTTAEGTLCHKPCTVSGGGKSEISKSINDAMHYGPLFVNDFQKDMAFAEKIINYDYSQRLINPPQDGSGSRDLLSPGRSLGSVIKLLTPSKLFTEEYNQWLDSIPYSIKALVFIIKRFYKEDWAGDWKPFFSVDTINGIYGHELKYKNRLLNVCYLRIGHEEDGSWRKFKLRQDFLAAKKVQWEDDISASIILPAEAFEHLNKEYSNPSVKITDNCEFRFFQRPDDAIIRGYDKQAEADLASDNVFVSNFEALSKADTKEMSELAIDLSKFTQAMRDRVLQGAKGADDEYIVSSAHPRIVNGVPTKNPRYLQTRPALIDQHPTYLANVGVRLKRAIAQEKPVHLPVNAVLAGRRNNPAEPGIRPLAVYNPVHYQELPELFMDFMCALTGKSPSTTGAGSEGALTKGPFNSLVATSDLNNSLLSFILCDYSGFSTAAGYIGRRYKVDHDISLLVPEIWCRLNEFERRPDYLLKHGYLEKIEDFEYQGELIPASRLGFRITKEFATAFLGKIFDNPETVFPSDMLRPEEQCLEEYVDGIKNIVETQTAISQNYINDGSVESAIPPLNALIHIMAEGNWKGLTLEDPEVRQLFTRESVIQSDWYKERLKIRQERELTLLKRHVNTLNTALADRAHSPAELKQFDEKFAWVNQQIQFCSSQDYLKSLVGTLGADPLHRA